MSTFGIDMIINAAEISFINWIIEKYNFLDESEIQPNISLNLSFIFNEASTLNIINCNISNIIVSPMSNIIFLKKELLM